MRERERERWREGGKFDTSCSLFRKKESAREGKKKSERDWKSK